MDILDILLDILLKSPQPLMGLFLVIAGSTESERQVRILNEAMKDLEEDILKFANAPGTQRNIQCKENKYTEYCKKAKLQAFPVDEAWLVKYAIYLSFTMETVDSIKAYCGTVCEMHELKGFPSVYRGKRYYRTIRSLAHILQHEVKQAQPVMTAMLKQIALVVDTTKQKQLAIWVSMLFGFFLFLRKSNLVPENRLHDPRHQLSRQDIKIDQNALIVQIKWSKTIQFGQ